MVHWYTSVLFQIDSILIVITINNIMPFRHRKSKSPNNQSQNINEDIHEYHEVNYLDMENVNGQTGPQQMRGQDDYISMTGNNHQYMNQELNQNSQRDNGRINQHNYVNANQSADQNGIASSNNGEYEDVQKRSHDYVNEGFTTSDEDHKKDEDEYIEPQPNIFQSGKTAHDYINVPEQNKYEALGERERPVPNQPKVYARLGTNAE